MVARDDRTRLSQETHHFERLAPSSLSAIENFCSGSMHACRREGQRRAQRVSGAKEEKTVRCLREVQAAREVGKVGQSP